MSHPKVNTFTSYELSKEEYISGCTLNYLTLSVIQNLRSELAEEKLNLTFTPNNVLDYTQQEAYLKGQIDMLNHLLDLHEAAQLPTTTNQ